MRYLCVTGLRRMVAAGARRAAVGTVMRSVRQTTLARSVTLSGIGLHCGEPGRVILHPEGEGAGLVFHFLDHRGARRGAPLAANAAAISETRLGTCLSGADGRSVRTIEHLLAAIAISGVDNIAIEIDGPEVPIMDGSAIPFLHAIDQAGMKSLSAAREVLKIVSPIEIADGERFIRAEPCDRRILEIDISFADAAIGKRSIALDLDNPASMRRLARARTFCRLADIDVMRAAGLGRGGSLDNAVVVDGERILNADGLRDPEEFVLHKALDVVGDLALAGAPIIGRISARRPGHDLNAQFLRCLAVETSAVERCVLREGAVSAVV